MPQRRTTDQPPPSLGPLPPPGAPVQAARGKVLPAPVQRLFAQRTLAAQQALVALVALVLATGLLWAWQAAGGPLPAAPWLPLTMLALGALAAGAAGVALGNWHGRSLAALAESARQLRRDDAPDDANVLLLSTMDELHQASVSLRRLVDHHRQQRQALQARNAALGQQLQQRTHELTTLQDLSVGLAASQDMTELVDEALKALEQTLEYTSASLWARDRRRMPGSTGADQAAQVMLMGYRLGEDSGQTDRMGADIEAHGSLRGKRLSRPNLLRYEQIERERAPIIDNHVRQGLLSWLWEKVTDDASTSALYRGSRAWMGVPLVFRDEVLGVMRVDHRTPGYFDAERARLLSAVCSQTALAMHHSQLLLQQRELAVAAERNRIARELHDAVSQTLFAANMVAGSLAKLATRVAATAASQGLESGLVGPPTEQADTPAADTTGERLTGIDNPWPALATEAEALLRQARTLERLNRGALAEMRLLMFELRPDALEHATLAELLAPVVEALQCRGDVVVLQDVASTDTLDPAVRVHLYRIVQEALSNVGRHSGAHNVRVLWQPQAPEGALLRISDDGQGFDPQAPRPGHFGVDNLGSRAAEIGAQLQIRSAPGEGTEVSVRLPQAASLPPGESPIPSIRSTTATP